MKRNKQDVFIDIVLWLILCSITYSLFSDFVHFIMKWRG